MRPAEKILAEVEGLLEEMSADAMREIASAKTRADANASRHDAAAEELAAVEGEISRLTAEREPLPGMAYRAGLDGHEEEEQKLAAKYRDLGRAVEDLEVRASALREEVRSLNPQPWGHHYDAVMEQYGQAAAVAQRHRAAVEAVEKRLTEALGRTVSPVRDEHERLRGAVSGMAVTRNADLSPVGRGGIRV